MSKKNRNESFGSAYADSISPAVNETTPRTINVRFTFEEALKLHLSLGEALRHLNSLDRRSGENKRAAASICVYPHKLRVQVVESRLPRPATGRSGD